jgi:hypothetical protein
MVDGSIIDKPTLIKIMEVKKMAKREYVFFNPTNGKEITETLYDGSIEYDRALLSNSWKEEFSYVRKLFNIPNEFIRCELYRSN